MKRVAGLQDYLPAQRAQQQALIERLQQPLSLFGYEQVETPLLEQVDLFLTKAGDAAINRLVTFDLAGKSLCLRPEFTAPAARYYIEHYQGSAGPVRLQFSGPIVHYQQLGRNLLGQQHAVGAELLNQSGPNADAEMIALAAQALQYAGSPQWQLVIGHSGFISRFLQGYGLNWQMQRFALRHLPLLQAQSSGFAQARQELEDLLSAQQAPDVDGQTQDTEAALQALLQATSPRGPMGGRSQEEIMRRLLSKQQQHEQFSKTLTALQSFQDILQHADTPQALTAYVEKPELKAAAEDIVSTFELLAAYELPMAQVHFDLSFTRNLDYYTGVVFEYRAVEGGDLLAGGGRYDELIRLLGAAQDVPAVGFTVNVENVLQACASLEQDAAGAVRVFVLAANTAEAKQLLPVVAWLRGEGYPVTFHVGEETPQARSGFSHLLRLNADRTLSVQAADTQQIQRIGLDEVPTLRAILEGKYDPA